MKNKWLTPYVFRWELCAHCEDYYIICPRCGNSCCSGGWGTVNGKPCQICRQAYDYQAIHFSNRPSLTDSDRHKIEKSGNWIHKLFKHDEII